MILQLYYEDGNQGRNLGVGWDGAIAFLEMTDDTQQEGFVAISYVWFPMLVAWLKQAHQQLMRTHDLRHVQPLRFIFQEGDYPAIKHQREIVFEVIESPSGEYWATVKLSIRGVDREALFDADGIPLLCATLGTWYKEATGCEQA